MTQHQLVRIHVAVNAVYICVEIQFFNLTKFLFPAKFIIGRMCDRRLAFIRYIGKILDGWQNFKPPTVWNFSEI